MQNALPNALRIGAGRFRGNANAENVSDKQDKENEKKKPEV